MNAQEIRQELERYANPAKKEFLPKFFKTGKGQYGEGDLFLGVVVPDTRSVAKRHRDEPFEVVEGLLCSAYHECRLCGLLMLVERFKRADEKERAAIYEFYLAQTRHINNWDLVDLSAPYIVGNHLKDKSREPLYRLADSPLLWEQRIAVVSTYAFVKDNDCADTYALAERLMNHKHDLIQKAVGWMLREAGKRDRLRLMAFLDGHAARMPRTMLRYAIEKFSEEERKYYRDKKPV